MFVGGFELSRRLWRSTAMTMSAPMSRTRAAGTLLARHPSTSRRPSSLTGRLMTGLAQLARMASTMSPVVKTTSGSVIIPRRSNGGPPSKTTISEVSKSVVTRRSGIFRESKSRTGNMPMRNVRSGSFVLSAKIGIVMRWTVRHVIRVANRFIFAMGVPAAKKAPTSAPTLVPARKEGFRPCWLKTRKTPT